MSMRQHQILIRIMYFYLCLYENKAKSGAKKRDMICLKVMDRSRELNEN